MWDHRPPRPPHERASGTPLDLLRSKRRSRSSCGLAGASGRQIWAKRSNMWRGEWFSKLINSSRWLSFRCPSHQASLLPSGSCGKNGADSIAPCRAEAGKNTKQKNAKQKPCRACVSVSSVFKMGASLFTEVQRVAFSPTNAVWNHMARMATCTRGKSAMRFQSARRVPRNSLLVKAGSSPGHAGFLVIQC